MFLFCVCARARVYCVCVRSLRVCACVYQVDENKARTTGACDAVGRMYDNIGSVLAFRLRARAIGTVTPRLRLKVG